MHRSGPLSLTFEGPELNKYLGVKTAKMRDKENHVITHIYRFNVSSV